MKCLLFFFAFLTLPSWAWAACTETFYVRGAGTAAAPHTIGGAYDASDFNTAGNWDTDNAADDKIGPGDCVIVLDDDGVIYSGLTPKASGLAGAPIQIIGEEGGSPVVSGALLNANWANTSGNVWETVNFFEPLNVVSFNGTRGVEDAAACPGALNAVREWCWAANKLYVYSTSDPDTAYVTPGIESAAWWYIVSLSDNDYIDISHIAFRHANGLGIRAYNSAHVTLHGITVSETSYACIYVDGSTANPSTYVDVTDSTILNCGGAGIQYAGDADGVGSSVISGNSVSASGWSTDATDNWNKWTAGIKVWGGMNLGDAGESDTVTISGNTVTGQQDKWSDGSGTGIWVDQWGTGAIVKNNLVHSNALYGILVENMNGAQVYYNIVYHPINNAGIVLYRSSSNNAFYNNTVYDVAFWGGFLCTGAIGENTMVNNIFKNNLVLSAHWGVEALNGCDNTGDGSGNVFSYNGFGPEKVPLMKWGAVEYNTYAAWLAASSQPNTNMNTDPLFVSATDFRLKPGSPAINAGVDVGLTQDFTGRYLVGLPDIGAYEFGASPTYWIGQPKTDRIRYYPPGSVPYKLGPN